MSFRQRLPRPVRTAVRRALRHTAPVQTDESWLWRYVDDGFAHTEGWVMPQIMKILVAVDRIQAEMGIGGGAMEIGIFRGRFFMALNALVDPAYRSLAIDLFDDQQLNIDGSGRGDERVFRENLARWDRHHGENVEILAADSTTLRPEEVRALMPDPPRFVSVDGGHTAEHTVSDIRLAQTVVHPRGVVLIDDILNPNWLGVIEGVVHYLSGVPLLWPFAIGYNKLLLCPMSVHRRYLAMLADTRLPGQVRHVRFSHHELLHLSGAPEPDRAAT